MIENYKFEPNVSIKIKDNLVYSEYYTMEKECFFYKHFRLIVPAYCFNLKNGKFFYYIKCGVIAEFIVLPWMVEKEFIYKKDYNWMGCNG